MSRTTSTNTITQVQNASLSGSPRSPVERHSVFAHRNRSREPPHLPVEASQKQTQRSRERTASPSAVASDSSASSSSDSEAPHPINRSRVFARRPRYSTSKAPLNPLSDADEEDEDTPFLPFSDARKATTPPPPTDPGATLKISPKRTPSHRQPPGPGTKLKSPRLPQTAHSSSSSAQSQPLSQNNRPPHNPLSTLSPRQRRLAKEGSDGTPSMGSSFSDLDDASVTQSAMEEALASNINRGVASRMSTISQAFRSNVFSGERKH